MKSDHYSGPENDACRLRGSTIKFKFTPMGEKVGEDTACFLKRRPRSSWGVELQVSRHYKYVGSLWRQRPGSGRAKLRPF